MHPLQWGPIPLCSWKHIRVTWMTNVSCEWSLWSRGVLFLCVLWSHVEALSFKCTCRASLYSASTITSRVSLSQMHPHFVVAAGMEKAQYKRTCHSSWKSDGLIKPHTSAHSPGTAPDPHNGVAPGGTGWFVSAKASSIVLVSRRSLPHGLRRAAPVKSPATKSTCSSSITLRTVRSNFILIPRFLANWLLMRNDIIVKNDLPLRGSRQNDAREMTPCRTHPDCPSFTTCCCPRLWYHGGTQKKP